MVCLTSSRTAVRVQRFKFSKEFRLEIHFLEFLSLSSSLASSFYQFQKSMIIPRPFLLIMFSLLFMSIAAYLRSSRLADRILMYILSVCLRQVQLDQTTILLSVSLSHFHCLISDKLSQQSVFRTCKRTLSSRSYRPYPICRSNLNIYGLYQNMTN